LILNLQKLQIRNGKVIQQAWRPVYEMIQLVAFPTKMKVFNSFGASGFMMFYANVALGT
jgi:hypothetical protein